MVNKDWKILSNFISKIIVIKTDQHIVSSLCQNRAGERLVQIKPVVKIQLSNMAKTATLMFKIILDTSRW
jgi:hypothetical protein